MGTTPTYSLPYPELADPADVPIDMQELASAVETAILGRLPADTVVVAGTRILANKLLAGDANNAWRVMGNGKMEWGAGGASALDTNLYRSAADTLQTDGGLVVNFGANMFHLHTDGRLYFGNAYDTSLWRSGANALMTDGSLTLDASNSGGRLYFGNTYDTDLFRESANSLMTNSALSVGRDYADATKTPLYLNVNGVWKQVLVGPADSAGAGFKTLRVAN